MNSVIQLVVAPAPFSGRRFGLARTLPLIRVAAAALLACGAGFAGETTIYVNEYFEVRAADQPTKFVFHEDTRVARITAALTSNARIQRLRLNQGWNLRSLGVTAADALHQLTNAQPAVLDSRSVYLWDPAVERWLPVPSGQSLPAGTILWLHSTTNATLPITGIPADSTDQTVAPGGSFISGGGLEGLSLPAPAAGLAVWRPDASGQVLSLEALAVPGTVPELPRMLSPGEAAFLDSTAPVELEAAPPVLRVRYYHPDHLGSSTAVTDASGALVEETAYYPFGVERHTERPQPVDNDYGFTQKERDDESGLHYFEARYLAGPIARFISPDPKYARLDGLSVDDLSSFLSRPSGINPYQYGGNNPLRYNDPTGLDKVDTAGKTADVVGIVAGVIEEADNVAGVMGKALPKALTTGGSIAGPVSSAVSVGIKAWEFGKDPSYATGGQLANEGAKALVGVAVPPVGLIWSVLDLTGYGPSAILEHTEKSIQANRAATRAYERATAASRQTVDLVNEKAPKIKAKLQQVDTKLQHLVRETDKLNQKTRKALKGETRSLQELNDAIRRQERINRRTAAELRRANARLREAEK